MKVQNIALVAAMLVSGSVLASVGGTGIKGTRHDFANRTNFLGSQVTNPGVANQVGLCSFCHTPHSAQSTALLWNKSMSTNTFKWDDATVTTGGTNFSTMAPGYKGATVKCLACHDGSVAVGDVSMYKGKVNPSVNTFKVGQQPDNFDGKTWAGTDARPQYVIGSSGLMNGTHPVGMPYPLGNAVNTYNGVTNGTEVALQEFVANPHTATGAAKGGGTAVTPTSAGGGTANALIKLYNDTGTGIVAGTAPGKSGMECSTCHDPHNKQTTDDWLLRGKAQGSTVEDGYICVQCHIK